MLLEKYNSKRNFSQTPEPEGFLKSSVDKTVFVVQRHHASQLHYDFRLEMEGVLKSWAVPKGPSMNVGDKRLAMMTEDHPLDYVTFEGDIPEGNYGAGHMDIWDTGTYHPINDKGKLITESDLLENLKNGRFRIELQGNLLKGQFSMSNINGDGKTWLLQKRKDEFAVAEGYDSETFAKPSSLAYTAMRNAQKPERTKKAK
jgi:bifunctional non-homologous end joining protein LigD